MQLECNAALTQPDPLLVAALHSIRQARAQADKKKVKQADSEKWALQQVRLLVDTGLMSAGGLGVNLLGELRGCCRGWDGRGGPGLSPHAMHGPAAMPGRPLRCALHAPPPTPPCRSTHRGAQPRGVSCQAGEDDQLRSAAA